MAGYELDGTYVFVMFTPLIVTLVVFHELMDVPRLVDCQQNTPAPSKMNGAVMVDVTGLHTPVPCVGVSEGVTVRVRVGVGLMGVKVGVRVGVSVGPVGVQVGA